MLLNFIAFQAGWFACVLGAAHGWPWSGTAAALAVVGLHAGRAARPRAELALAALAMAGGAVWDSGLALSGWLQYASAPAASPWTHLAPPWIVAMWALFATTLNVTLRWLRGRWLLAALLGAVAGPLSYLAGVRLGAARLVEPALALGALAVEWSLMLPALVALAPRLDGIGARAVEARA
jgi:hypothetical protein